MKDFLTKILEYYDLDPSSYLDMIKEPSYESLKDSKFFDGIEDVALYLKQY